MLQLYMHLASSRLACRDIQRIQPIQPIQLYSYTRYTAYSTIQRPSDSGQSGNHHNPGPSLWGEHSTHLSVSSTGLFALFTRLARLTLTIYYVVIDREERRVRQ